MAEINLLQSHTVNDQPSAGFALRVIARLLTIILILVLIVYGLLWFYNWSAQKKLVTTRNDIDRAQRDAIASKDRNELITRQEQLTSLETLLDNHVYWSFLLPELARVTLKSAHYTEINAQKDGSLDLTVNLPNYEEIEKYLQIFDLPEFNQQFSDVRILGINNVQSANAIETQMRIKLNFNPEYIKGRR